MPSSAALVAKLTDAVGELQAAIGIEDTRRLLVGLAKGLGKPESSASRVIDAPPTPGPRGQAD